MRAKLIEYAYPTSSTASSAGFGKTGCYFVGLYESEKSCKRIETLPFFSSHKQEVKDYAESLPYPYNWMAKYDN